MFPLFLILAVDAFRTLFESSYFGAWYTARVGLLPTSIYDFLVRPEMVFIPKVLNVLAAGLIITILFRYWLPREGEEIKHLEKSVRMRTRELSETVERLESEISHRKRIEGRLQQSEAKYVDLYENAPDMYFTLNAKTARIEECNRTCVISLGYAKEEIIGQPVFNVYHPECREEARATFESFVQTGEVHDKELRLRRRDGSELDVSLSASAVRGEDGQVLYSRSTFRDIAERKRAEETIRQLNAELEQRARERTAELESANKELEAFSYSVSHDLRAPLRHLTGFVNLFTKHASEGVDGTGMHYLAVISDSATQMGKLIDDMLSFSRMGRVGFIKTRVSMDDLVQEVLDIAQADMADRDIVWSIGPLPAVYGSREMLRTVLSNLISNAIKFTERIVHARIEIGHFVEETDQDIFFVRDNGAGFDMAYADKLFGLFQRLHRMDEFPGTGVGLANVQRIIQRHGGRTWAEGVVGEGATFYFSLPSPLHGA